MTIGAFIVWNEARRDSPGYVIDGNGCHIWVGSRDLNGYGHVRADGTVRLVHRVRYEREVGPIPEGMELDHYVCDNGHGGCCNPLHCRPVSHRENMLRSKRSFAADNLAKTHCPKGHQLTESNLAAWGTKEGWRVCRACCNDRSAQSRAKRKRLASS